MSERHLKDETRPSSGHVDAQDAGCSKGLNHRHLNMIAIGGAIGTGLFLGAGGRLVDAGPGELTAYAVCGLFAFVVAGRADEPLPGAVRRNPARPSYRLPGSPWTEVVTLAFLASVLVLMYADVGAGRTTVLCLPPIVATLVAGRYGIRGRISRTSTGADA